MENMGLCLYMLLKEPKYSKSFSCEWIALCLFIFIRRCRQTLKIWVTMIKCIPLFDLPKEGEQFKNIAMG